MDKQIALSFDDGPSSLTPWVLDALYTYGAKATFFILGDQIAGRERQLEQLVERGHELGIHGWDHSRHAPLADLKRTASAIRDACGYEATLFRPTYGDVDPSCPWPATLWDIDSEDWRQPEAGEMVANIVGGAFDGCIVDLHDGRRVGPQTVRAVATLLPMLHGQGYEMVTISSLHRRRPRSRRPPKLHERPKRLPSSYDLRGALLGNDDRHRPIRWGLR